MPHLATIAVFSAAALALACTPGPDMLLILSRTVAQGRSAGFASILGAQAGIYCHAIAVALGLAMKLIGAAMAVVGQAMVRQWLVG